MTSSLPRKCSTAELYEPQKAIERDLERVAGIEPASSAWKAEVLPLNYTRNASRLCLQQVNSVCRLPLYGGGGWIRTTEAYASDLQSDPFGHSGTPPQKGRAFSTLCDHLSTEHTAPALSRAIIRKFGAGERSRTPDRLITSQLLYLLSYASALP